MFPIDNINKIKSDINYINNRTTLSSYGVIPHFDMESGEFLIDDRGSFIMLKDEDAIRMWIKKVLSTKMNRYEIYYDQFAVREYGTDLKEHYLGKRVPEILMVGEIGREIKEALEQHQRIKRVENFDVQSYNTSLQISFEVVLADSQERLQIKEEVRLPRER